MEKCSNCKFFYPVPHEECRRHAPANIDKLGLHNSVLLSEIARYLGVLCKIPDENQDVEIDAEVTDYLNDRWPYTNSDNWCGEYMPALSAGAVDSPNPQACQMIDWAKLSGRAKNCLQSEGVRTYGDLYKLTDAELLLMPNLGPHTLREIREFCAKHRSMFLP